MILESKSTVEQGARGKEGGGRVCYVVPVCCDSQKQQKQKH